jgi:hypothetical protein
MSQPRFALPDKEHSRSHYPMAYAACWSCGQPSDHHCGPGDPGPGDVFICLNCTDPSLFSEDGTLRQPHPDEHAAIIAEPEYRKLAEVVRAANRQAMTRQQEGEARRDRERD